jgi:hypothetical protein
MDPAREPMPTAIGFGFMSEFTGTGVIDQELWERVNAAIPAVNAAIDRHLAAGGWVPPRMSRC